MKAYYFTFSRRCVKFGKIELLAELEGNSIYLEFPSISYTSLVYCEKTHL